MKSISNKWFTFVLISLLAARTVRADNAKKPASKDACTATIKTAVDKAFPKATITKCKAETDKGVSLVEVKISKADGNAAEIDVALDGKILQVEEKVAIDKVPAAVMKAFAAKYPKAKADRAEKQSPTDGKPSYEIAFKDDKGKKEATFTEDGKFVEEE